MCLNEARADSAKVERIDRLAFAELTACHELRGKECLALQVTQTGARADVEHAHLVWYAMMSSATPNGPFGRPWLSRDSATRRACRSASCCRAIEQQIAASRAPTSALESTWLASKISATRPSGYRLTVAT